jgi:hypothetical protein
MARSRTKSEPAWIDVRDVLANFDRAGLVGLLHDLYAASKDTRTFLHSRFGLVPDVLKPYKETISRWVSPDVFRNQNTSIVKARQAISEYKKAVGESAGLAELMVFFCEQAAGFCSEFGNDDEGYYAALVRMYEQALKIAVTLNDVEREALFARLEQVRGLGHNCGYGVGEDMDFLFTKHTDRLT